MNGWMNEKAIGGSKEGDVTWEMNDSVNQEGKEWKRLKERSAVFGVGGTNCMVPEAFYTVGRPPIDTDVWRQGSVDSTIPMNLRISQNRYNCIYR
jgi:hypothetical protein